MAIRKIASKSFKLKKDAVEWAKKKKKAQGPESKAKWETNRTKNTDRPWEGVVFREIS
jgi:hypothetical protein